MNQRDTMRQLYRDLNREEDAVVSAYASAERSGKVARTSNTHQTTPEQYARALFNDGIRKRWLK